MHFPKHGKYSIVNKSITFAPSAILTSTPELLNQFYIYLSNENFERF